MVFWVIRYGLSKDGHFWEKRERVSSENSSTVGSCVGLDKTDREIGLIVYCWKIQ
jgi:hypothetical protein